MQQQRLQRLRRIVVGDDNPLRRYVDRLESAVAASLVIAFLIVAPLLAIVCVQAVGSAAAREQRAESTWRSVQAVLTQSAEAGQVGQDGVWGVSWVTAKWTAPDGAIVHGLLPVDLSARADQHLAIWVTATGKPAHPPLTNAEVLDREVMTAIAVASALALVLSTTGWAVRAAANRRRMLGWTKAWEVIGPRWSSLR
jgi:hypothetical protein